MNDYDFMSAFSGFIVAVVLGVCLVILADFADELPEQAYAAIYECELSIPRNQHCVITATPKEK